MEARKPITVTKKKMSPSTLTRNARRKEDFLAKRDQLLLIKLRRRKQLWKILQLIQWIRR